MKKSAFLLCFLFLFTIAIGSAYANLVTNGSFEDPTITNSNGWDVFSSIPGWSVGPGSTDLELQRNNLLGWSWSAKDGNQWAELDGYHNTTIYQTIATSPGTKYTLEFYFSPRPGHNDNQLAWTIGNQSGFIRSDGSSLSSTFWTYFSLEFTANSNSTILQFHEIGRDDSLGMFLDGVSVTANVPIPAAAWMLGTGLIGLVAIRRRRK
jgi:hypothetical protein